MMFGAAALLWAMLAPSPADLAINPAQAIDPASWVTTEDYPPVSILRKETGLTAVLLDVTAEGRVSRCTITASSGSTLLDVTTCALMEQRGRYEPATDRNGHAVASDTKRSIFWSLPENAQPSAQQQALAKWIPMEMSIGVTVDVDIDDKGTVQHCSSNQTGKAGQDPFAGVLERMGKELCEQTENGEASQPMRDKSGKAVPSRLTVVLKADFKQR